MYALLCLLTKSNTVTVAVAADVAANVLQLIDSGMNGEWHRLETIKATGRYNALIEFRNSLS